MRDLTIQLDNRPGALAEMGEALGRAGVSVEGGGSTRGAHPATAAAMARMCSGVVPQQPPTMFSQPSSANSRSTGAIDSGVASKPVSERGFGSPAFG